MMSARPVTALSGSPPAMPLAETIRSGTTPSCSMAYIAPVRAKPVCPSWATKTTPFSRHHCASGQEAGGRHDEAALALDGLDHDGGQVVGTDLRLDQVDRAGSRVATGKT